MLANMMHITWTWYAESILQVPLPACQSYAILASWMIQSFLDKSVASKEMAQGLFYVLFSQKVHAVAYNAENLIACKLPPFEAPELGIPCDAKDFLMTCRYAIPYISAIA